MQQRRGTEAQWISTNNGNGPVLNAGEIGFETDTNRFKIGDGVNHWVDLNYFADSVELGGSIDDYIPLTQKGANNGVAELDNTGKIPSSQIPALVGLDSEITTAVNNAVSALVDGAPGALNTLNELAAALNDDANFAATVATAFGDIDAAITLINNNKAETSAVAGLAVDAVAGALTEGSGIDITHDAQGDIITIDVKSTIATKTYSDDAVSTHNQDTTNVHGIDDTAVLVTFNGTQTIANKTLNDPTIVVDPSGANISISSTELGYLNGVTSNIQDQLDDKVLSADIAAAAQDAVGGSIGTGLAYDTNTNILSVDQTAIQIRVANVSDTEIGYLNGVTSGIQTQLDAKASATSPTISSSLTLDGTGDFTISADANIVFDADTEVYIGSAASGNEVATKSYVDSGLSDKLDSATAATTYAELDGANFTGNVEVDGNLVVDGDFTVNGTNFSASATTITIEDNLVQLAHQNSANTVDLGLVVAYNDGAAKHAGIVRDVSEAKWKLFKGVSTEPSTVVAFGEGSLDDLQVAGFEASSATIGDVSNTELQYLNGVTSAIQTQLNAKAPTADPTFTGTVSGVTKAHVGLGNVDNTSDANKPVSTATQTALDAKANALVTIDPETASYTLILSNREQMVEMNVGSANTLTVPTNSSVAFPIGTRIHVVQTGSGQTTITPASGVTVNGTPGLKTRAQWSAVTLVKRGTDTWVAFGDLTA